MGFKFSDTATHWNYVVALERDLETAARFIEPTEANMNAYSIELARVLLAAASEVDVVAKLICKSVAPTKSPSKIGEYYEILSRELPSLFHQRVYLRRYGLSSQPFDTWTKQTPPGWWTANNKVKHERNEHFDMATLGNALNAVEGLYLMVLYHLADSSQGDPGEESPSKSRIRRVLNRVEPRASILRLEDGYHAQALVV